ncbi:KAP family P-loop NTPase fold protein [Vibrio mediterranei]|uniref:KAP NTPase domain-containing protein n=1 Tax=Vibrio mediterranei TaxID=689 RepID=A0ABX5D6R9_9VIBR|nr:P-loop NTPase fold protein [Vibrio mediterranei]PCD85404.1 hypothetical protein COR52_26810 [Vibrio mediterranei]PRQ64637.1 hypothetical protein COR51_26360 [Vibrio mediterranei]
MSSIHFVPTSETFDMYQIIDNKPYANHLTQYLKSKAENGYVLNLNAEWGAGKTTFLQCWYNELKNEHPVVYFDAWKSDFTKDPMLALMDAFQQQLISPLSNNRELIENFISKGSHFVKAALPSLIVGYIKNRTGIDDEDSLLSTASQEFGIPEKDLSDALKDTMKAMITQKKRVEGIEGFKDALVQLSNDYMNVHSNSKKPVFVLIDELDRCRPTYAIETIECVKHFFNIENFIFVLATDTNQLQHSIKSIYGSNFDSLTYLSRFFDNSATLPAPNRKQYVETTVTRHLNGEVLSPKAIDFIGVIFEWHDTRSLREIQKILNIVDIARSQKKSYKIIVLIILSLLKKRYPNHYEVLKTKGTPPYISRHGSPGAEHIRGRHTIFELTEFNKERADVILYMAVSGGWFAREVKELNKYMHKMEGMGIDELACALIRESASNQDLIEASLQEHFSLIEFAGFFQG